eukprot:Skav205462  [mRNA]  locus=scaffold4885:183738:186955:+ [translate_table: standard]
METLVESQGSDEINAEAEEVLKSVEEAEGKLQSSAAKFEEAKAQCWCYIVLSRGQLAKISAAIKLAREKAQTAQWQETLPMVGYGMM